MQSHIGYTCLAFLHCAFYKVLLIHLVQNMHSHIYSICLEKTTMRFWMFPQIACPRRGIVTLIAFVWLFSTVRSEIHPQMAWSVKRMHSHIASNLFVVSPPFIFNLSSNCLPQKRHSCIGTLDTLVWFNDIVHSFLWDSYICTLWNKVIIFHLFNDHVCCALPKWLNFFWSLSVKFSILLLFNYIQLSLSSPAQFCIAMQSIDNARLRAWS